MSDLPIIDSGPSERGWSYYAAFLRCPMLFFWRYVYTPKTGQRWSDYSHALARGTLVHVGLAHYYAQMWALQNGRDPDRIPPPETAMPIVADRIGDLGREMLPVAVEMVRAYLQRYPLETFRVIAVEEPVAMRFGEALYTARLDLTVQEPDGRIYVYDTKTTSMMKSQTVRRYTLHGQFFGQAYLARSKWGDSFGGVVVNVIDETGRCHRERTPPSPFMFRHFPGVIEVTAKNIEHAKEVNGDDAGKWASFAAPDEQICFGPYGQCPAFDLCRWGPP